MDHLLALGLNIHSTVATFATHIRTLVPNSLFRNCSRSVQAQSLWPSFAGAFIGYVAREGKLTPEDLKQAVIAGNLVASFTVQGFGTKTIAGLTKAKLKQRSVAYHKFASIPKVKI